MKKYSIALLLWKFDPNPQGHFPIYLRVTIEGKRILIASGYFVHKNFWDPKSQKVKEGHPHASVINPDITGKKNQVMHFIVAQQMAGKAITAAQVKDHFVGGKDMHNIFDFIVEHKKNVQHKREPGTIGTYERFERKLELYHKSRSLAFEQIDQNYLQAFENSLRTEGLDDGYIFLNMSMLQRFFNAARKREIITNYPFANYEMPAYQHKEKDYLSMPELRRLEEYADQVADLTLKQTAIYFLLGCLTGLRISDWFRFDLKKHVLTRDVLLRTKKNGEWVTMPISAALKRNLKRIEAVPLTISEPEINSSLKDIAAEIEAPKYLTSHSGRHTFAVTMCCERGIGLEVCAELMGITIAVCAKAYYRVTSERIRSDLKKAWKDL